jgi:hypothetical protein
VIRIQKTKVWWFIAHRIWWYVKDAEGNLLAGPFETASAALESAPEGEKVEVDTFGVFEDREAALEVVRREES